MAKPAYTIKIKEICERVASAFTKKQNLDTFWQEVAELHYPERATFTVSKILGSGYTSENYSAAPILHRREFGNWLGAILRPKGRDWFKPRARDNAINDLPEVQTYLTNKAQVHRSLLYDYRSQFIRSNAVADHDYITFGNSVQLIDELSEKNGLLFRTFHLKDCAWFENDDGVVDTLFRKMKMQLRDVIQQKGWDIPQAVRERASLKPYDEIEVYHAFFPIEDLYEGAKPDREGAAYLSCYIDIANKHLLSKKEERLFRYVVSRWFTLDGSPYAVSPCVMASLPDARSIQAMVSTILEAGEKSVNPPLVGVSEAITGPVNLYAGGVTYVDPDYDERSGEALRALDMGKHPEMGVVLLDRMQDSIASAWYVNKLFLPPPSANPMTAEETARRMEEYLRVSQPIIEPAEAERNGLLLDTSMSIAMLLGYWGPMSKEKDVPDDMPDALKGRQVDLTYDNPIEDARRLSKTQAFPQVVGLAAQAGQVDPAAPAMVAWKKAFKDAVAGVAPPDWLLPEQEAEEATEAAGEMVKEEAAMGQAGQVIDMAAMAAKAAPKEAA